MQRRTRHDRGATIVEYALLLGLIALVAIGGLAYLGVTASKSMSDSNTQIDGTSSTTAAPTATTRPPGVPRDWPADKPIPPVPADCRQPQLEDNGVWNCQH